MYDTIVKLEYFMLTKALEVGSSIVTSPPRGAKPANLLENVNID